MKRIGFLLVPALAGLACLWLIFMDPAKLKPDNPAGKTIYYAVAGPPAADRNGNDRYVYELTGYTDRGKSKKLRFSASKQLRQGAYLMLYATPLRGVTHWEEVTADELAGEAKRLVNDE